MLNEFQHSNEVVSVKQIYPEKIDYDEIMKNAAPLEGFKKDGN